MKNFSPAVVELKTTEKGELTTGEAKNDLAIFDVLKNGLNLGKVGNYKFVEKNGKVYRIGENGVEFPPISKEKYEKIAKMRKLTLSAKNSIKTTERKLTQKQSNLDKEIND